DPNAGLTHLCPAPATIAELDLGTLAMPDSRRRTFIALAQALADGKLDLRVGGDWDTALERLAEVPGVGPWTLSTIAMRALGDPDAFLPTDLGVRVAAEARGLPRSPAA